MSNSTKRQMSMAAAAKTRAQQEREARTLIEATNCPLVVVFARSGAPSTQSSWTCMFGIHAGGYDPNCASYGQVDGPIGCAWLRRLRERGDVTRFLILRRVQCALDAYEIRAAGNMAWWTGPEINEGCAPAKDVDTHG